MRRAASVSVAEAERAARRRFPSTSLPRSHELHSQRRRLNEDNGPTEALRDASARWTSEDTVAHDRASEAHVHTHTFTDTDAVSHTSSSSDPELAPHQDVLTALQSTLCRIADCASTQLTEAEMLSEESTRFHTNCLETLGNVIQLAISTLGRRFPAPLVATALPTAVLNLDVLRCLFASRRYQVYGLDTQLAADNVAQDVAALAHAGVPLTPLTALALEEFFRPGVTNRRTWFLVARSATVLLVSDHQIDSVDDVLVGFIRRAHDRGSQDVVQFLLTFRHAFIGQALRRMRAAREARPDLMPTHRRVRQ
jgi:hypothetical protein